MARQEGINAALKKETSVFFCDCCNKQYVKITEWENHLSSYDHHHKKRFKEMQARRPAPARLARGWVGVGRVGGACVSAAERARARQSSWADRSACHSNGDQAEQRARAKATKGAKPKKERKDPAMVAAEAAAAAAAAAAAGDAQRPAGGAGAAPMKFGFGTKMPGKSKRQPMQNGAF